MPDPLGDFSFTWPFYAAALAGYLVGSIPFGLIVTRLAGLGNIRAVGSGNIGATNVLRTGHKALAALTLVLDAGKGAAAVLVANQWGPDMAVLAGAGSVVGHMTPMWINFKKLDRRVKTPEVLLAATLPVVVVVLTTWLLMAGLPRHLSAVGLAFITVVIGYVFPAWLKFEGGKGVATTLGVLLAIAWPVGALAGLTWVAVAFAFRYSSLAGLVSLAAAPLYAAWLADPQRTELAGFLAVLVITRHYANIRRLIKGEESRIGQ